MLVTEEQTEQDLYSLYNWIYHSGLGRGEFLDSETPEEMQEALRKIDFSKEMVLSGAGNDANGSIIGTFISSTKYDPETGTWDDKLTYSRHLPYAHSEGVEKEDMNVLHIRSVRAPGQDPEEPNPVLWPSQIWFGGSLVFSGPHSGGRHDPYRPEYQRLIARIKEFSQRVKERLNAGKPIEGMGQVFAGGNLPENLSAAITGGAPFLRGITPKGQWDETESALTDYFTRKSYKDGDKLKFSLPAIGNLNTVERLKALHGHRQNSVEPYRALGDKRKKIADHLPSGVNFEARTRYENDPETGHHVFRISLRPVYEMNDADVAKPFDVARVEYQDDPENPDGFILKKAQFMEGSPGKFKSWSKAMNLIGMIQDCNQDFADGEYPRFRDHAAEHRLLKYMEELGPPPSLDEGGESLWIPVYGTSMEKKIDTFGDGVGGGNVFLHRGRKANGDISTAYVIQGFPLAIGTSDSDVDAMNADFDPFTEGNEGVFVIDHDHFDHASLQFYAKRGKMKGEKVICNKRVQYIIEQSLTNLEVSKDQYPQFINYDHPDMVDLRKTAQKVKGEDGDDLETENGHYAYPVKDEEGLIRFWIQICENGSDHSALTDSHIITPCVDNKFVKDSYYTSNDSYGLTKAGWEFAERGQLALADNFDKTGMSYQELRKAIDNEDQLYITLEETTGITSDGHAPTPEEFKDTFRECMKAMPSDMAAVLVPFSTNHKEYQAIREVWAESGTIRHTTSVGANAEIRTSCMNQFGTNPQINLQNVEVTYNKLPQEIYDVSLGAIRTELFAIVNREIALAERRNPKMTPSERQKIIEDARKTYDYQVLNYVINEVNKEQKKGQTKSEVIHKYFLSGNETAYEEIVEKIGLERSARPRHMPNVVVPALVELKKHKDEWLRENISDDIERRIARDSNPAYWMLRSIVNHGKVKFHTMGSLRETNMYYAIINEQEEASLASTRTSDEAKKYRENPGKLGIISTGPTGTAEEHFASASRYSRYDSLFDYDELVRNTGYHMPPEKMIWFITQPPSMGDKARRGQDRVLQDIAANRGNTIFCAYKNGFRIHNPKEHLTHFEEHFKNLGWKVKWHPESNQLRVSDQPLHIHGHGFFHDLLDKHTDKRLKSKLTEVIHNPGWDSFRRFLELMTLAGRHTSIKTPDDHVARQPVKNKATGQTEMQVKDYLTPSYWLIRLRRKYGQQYGGILEMFKAVLLTQHGNKRADGLDVRSDKDGEFRKNTGSRLQNAFIKSWNGPGARNKMMNPAVSNVQKTGGEPTSPMLGWNM